MVLNSQHEEAKAWVKVASFADKDAVAMAFNKTFKS